MRNTQFDGKLFVNVIKVLLGAGILFVLATILLTAIAVAGINSAFNADYALSEFEYVDEMNLETAVWLIETSFDVQVGNTTTWDVYLENSDLFGATAGFYDRAALFIKLFQFVKPALCLTHFPDVTTIVAQQEYELLGNPDGYQMKSLCQTMFMSQYSDLHYGLDYYQTTGKATIPYYTVKSFNQLDGWFWYKIQLHVEYYLPFILVISLALLTGLIARVLYLRDPIRKYKRLYPESVATELAMGMVLGKCKKCGLVSFGTKTLPRVCHKHQS